MCNSHLMLSEVMSSAGKTGKLKKSPDQSDGWTRLLIVDLTSLPWIGEKLQSEPAFSRATMLWRLTCPTWIYANEKSG